MLAVGPHLRCTLDEALSLPWLAEGLARQPHLAALPPFPSRASQLCTAKTKVAPTSPFLSIRGVGGGGGRGGSAGSGCAFPPSGSVFPVCVGGGGGDGDGLGGGVVGDGPGASGGSGARDGGVGGGTAVPGVAVDAVMGGDNSEVTGSVLPPVRPPLLPAGAGAGAGAGGVSLATVQSWSAAHVTGRFSMPTSSWSDAVLRHIEAEIVRLQIHGPGSPAYVAPLTWLPGHGAGRFLSVGGSGDSSSASTAGDPPPGAAAVNAKKRRECAVAGDDGIVDEDVSKALRFF